VALPETSVSGLSSGAYMAGQVELAHAKDIVGAGIVAGGPFGCALSASSRLFPYWPMVMRQNAMLADHECMQVDWGAPDATALVTKAKDLAEDGKIDPLSALGDDKVYLFSGNSDETVRRPVVEAAERFYEAAGVPAASLTLVESSGGHAFLTETEGASCGVTKSPFIDDCDYDQAKAILEWIYGRLAPPSPSLTGRFIAFDQTVFDKEPPNGLAKEGIVYVPSACATERGCRLHIVFHGCDEAALPVTPTPTGWSFSFPKFREVLPIRTDAGTGGAIATWISWRKMRRRSRPSGPWPSASPRSLEGTACLRRPRCRSASMGLPSA
jgi:hypothetical protein